MDGNLPEAARQALALLLQLVQQRSTPQHPTLQRYAWDSARRAFVVSK